MAPGTFEFAEVNFNIDAIYLMAYNATANTYSGSVVNIASPQIFKIEPEHDTDKLPGAGMNLRGLSVPKGAKVTIEAGGLDRTAFAVLTGNTVSTAGTGSNEIATIREAAGGAGIGYFGAICAGPTDDGGMLTAGLQMVKLDKNPELMFEGKESKFNMWSCEGYAFPVQVSSVYRLRVIKFHETAADFTPPTDAASFLAYF